MFGMPLVVAVLVFVLAFAALEVAFGIACGFLLRDRSRHYPRPR